MRCAVHLVPPRQHARAALIPEVAVQFMNAPNGVGADCDDGDNHDHRHVHQRASASTPQRSARTPGHARPQTALTRLASAWCAQHADLFTVIIFTVRS